MHSNGGSSNHREQPQILRPQLVAARQQPRAASNVGGSAAEIIACTKLPAGLDPVRCSCTGAAEDVICVFQHDDGSKMPPDMLVRIRIILSALHAAEGIEGVDLPTFRLHPLKGDLKGFFSITVRANWRIIFRFEKGDVFDIDFVDYH